MPHRACAFCQSIANKISNEDAIPFWVIGLLGPNIKLDLFRSGKSPKSWRIAGRRGGLRINEICKQCNEGWMSDLETLVRPFLENMITRGAPTRFDGKRSCDLSSWGWKTTMVMDLLNDVTERHFSPIDRRQFNVIPSIGNVGSAVYLGRYSGKRYHALTFDQFFGMTTHRSDGSLFSFQGYSVDFQDL